MENQINNFISTLKSALFFEIILVVFLVLSAFIISVVKKRQEEGKAKTLLLTSSGLDIRADILKLLQKPSYNTSVAFIATAAKPEENQDYVKKDLQIMRDDMGFNVEEIDIEGKREADLMRMLEVKDIIFVEGGNTFYLLKAMQDCNFKKVIRTLLKRGIVYIGVSAGSIVAGKTIETVSWRNADKNTIGLKNLKGLNLVPFNIFVHYQSTYDEIIKQKMKNPKKRQKQLKILADGQALLVQGPNTYYLGQGEPIVV